MIPCIIEAGTLDEAYFSTLTAAYDDEGKYTHTYKIDHGSFAGEGIRKQFFSYVVAISQPYTRPLAPIFPTGVMPTTSDDNIEKYLATYLLNDTPDEKSSEDYIYGTFIYNHLPYIIKLLRKTPNTNHAVVNIGEPFEYYTESFEGLVSRFDVLETRIKIYEYPPCLRCIHWSVVDGKLNINLYWRSWDLFAGMPENLGGLQLLNEYVALETGLEPGSMVAYSSGAHVYGYQMEAIKAYLRR